jgi:peptidyl-prolyl cis-trans isomerase A (cyclophilin A)
MSANIRFALLFIAALTMAVSTVAAQSAQTPSSTPASSPQIQATPDRKATQDLPDTPDNQAHAVPQLTGPTAVLDTSMGRIICQLFDKQAPETVANFIGLAQGTKDWTDPVTHAKVRGRSLYNGTTFHRVIPDFMVQGGDPVGDGTGDPGYLFKDEFNPDLNFDVPGRLAMANSGPNTNGSQFFITEVPTEHLNQKHTIFGQCDEHSILVVQSMARVEKDRQDKPIDPIVLKKVTIVPNGQPIPSLPQPGTQATPAGNR